jgi:hypothetical protein
MRLFKCFFWSDRINTEQLFAKNMHYTIIKKIRNNVILNKVELEFIKNLPHEELFKIIEINQDVIKRMSESLICLEK